VLIAQISDPHVMLADDPMAGFVDTPARLRAAVASLTALPALPDVVLLTGDLVNRGRPEEYEIVRDALAPVDDRVLAIPGNHDDRDAFREAFADHAHLPATGHLSYVVDDHPLRLVGLDTTVAGRDDGVLDDERIAWLRSVLGQGPAGPTVLFMHHPPAPTGMWWMDYGGLKGRAELRALVDDHPEVLRILAGHVHRTTSTTWGPTVLSTAPSPFYATSTPVGDVEVPRITAVPAAIPVFRWDEDGDVLVASELDPPGAHPGMDFPDVFGERWDDYAARARSGAEMPNAM
jgi:3',5'-cyclic-AMP phosphodiesterase